jgi:hypothetical protein
VQVAFNVALCGAAFNIGFVRETKGAHAINEPKVHFDATLFVVYDFTLNANERRTAA